MEPHPKHCLICGAAIAPGIDAHVRMAHKMDYDEYCKYFYDAAGSYSIFSDKDGKKILTITRRIKPS